MWPLMKRGPGDAGLALHLLKPAFKSAVMSEVKMSVISAWSVVIDLAVVRRQLCRERGPGPGGLCEQVCGMPALATHCWVGATYQL